MVNQVLNNNQIDEQKIEARKSMQLKEQDNNEGEVKKKKGCC